MLLSTLCLLLLGYVGGELSSNITICEGEKNSRFGGNTDIVKWLRDKYGSNCHHVRYHLIIRDVKPGANLSFLDSIEEVYGSVIIKNSAVRLIPLRNLKVIRGHYLYHLYNASLLIMKNSPTSPGIIDLRSLKSITRGNVKVMENRNLCYLNSVDWRSLLEYPKTQGVNFSKVESCAGDERCSEKCSNGSKNSSCWGPGAEYCQKSHRCKGANWRCYFENNKEHKCHEQCIGGCTGSKSTDCIACKDYVNDNKCVSECPHESRLNPIDQKYTSTTNFRFEHGFFCVKQCPETFYSINQLGKAECLTECPKNYRGKKENKAKTCVPCHENSCSTTYCRLDKITETLSGPAKIRSTTSLPDIRLSRGLLEKLENCTDLIGGLLMDSISTTLYSSFGVDQEVRAEDLTHLSKLRDINGFVNLQFGDLKSVTNLSFLSNLESVTTTNKFSIVDGKNVLFLGFKNLKTLAVKEIRISNLPNLCYMENFENRFRGGHAKIVVKKVSSFTDCKSKNMTCDAECNEDLGCWGPGPELCVKCKHNIAGSRCVRSCNSTVGFFQTGNATKCEPCNEECRFHCSGPGSHQCVGGCRRAQNEGKCVAQCPKHKFKDGSGICRNCSSVCSLGVGPRLCSGPAKVYGEGGCDFCDYVKLPPHNSGLLECLFEKEKRGYFVNENVPSVYLRKSNGRRPTYLSPCHKSCKSCIGKATQCSSCKPGYYFFEDTCLDKCREISYVVESVNATELKCARCHGECRGCHGPTQYDCKSCRITKIYTDKDRTTFYCNSSCPQHSPHKVPEGDDFVCQESDPFAFKTIVLVMLSIVVVLFLIPMLAYNCYHRRQRKLKRQAQMLHVMYIRRDDENAETHCNAESSQLQIIGINQLKMLNSIGAGAFGTVYRGIWQPPVGEDGHQMKITVAIKVLKDQTDKKSTDEFMSEARVMASVDNQNCMHLLGVCCSSKLMLITEFMPTGNLQNYVMNNAQEIGNRRMLRWSLEIAKGMKYLGSKGIVHRDLAARNVLLDNHDSVRITDFGLSKLNEGDKEFQEKTSRLPIRWLAIECIRYQIFSTKSDVWAYGITLWEVFSYGESPYRDIQATGIYHHLVCGERLPQPRICTLDLYMLLLKCWLNDPESRPTFDELINDIEQKACEPGRYLIIESSTLKREPVGSSSKTPSSSSQELKLRDGQKHLKSKNLWLTKLQHMSSLEENDDVFEEAGSTQGTATKRDYINVPRSEPILQSTSRKYVNVSTNFDVHNIGYENPLDATAVSLKSNSPHTSMSTVDDYLLPDAHGKRQNPYAEM